MTSARVTPRVKMVCQSCKRAGRQSFGDGSKPRWCRCTKAAHGPIVMAPGVVVMVRFEPSSDAAFRERCRLASNAHREAVETLRSDKWVRCGKGYRELPLDSPTRKKLEASYDSTLAALEALQAECPHRDRSPYQPEYCDCCYAHVESDIEQRRHLVREGFYPRKRRATQVAA